MRRGYNFHPIVEDEDADGRLAEQVAMNQSILDHFFQYGLGYFQFAQGVERRTFFLHVVQIGL